MDTARPLDEIVSTIDQARTALGDLGGLGDAEAFDLLERLTGLTAAVGAAQVTVANEIRRARISTHGHARGLAREVGLAMKSSHSQARTFLKHAHGLVHEMPQTLRLLTSGDLTPRRAHAAAEESQFLDSGKRAEVDEKIAETPAATTYGDRDFAAFVRGVAQHVDPDSAIERQKAAVRQRRVTVRPAPDGMAYFTLVAPLPHAVAAFASLKKQTDTAPGGARHAAMADEALARLTGRADGVTPVAVSLVMSDKALLDDDAPATLGRDPIPARLARELIAAGIDAGDTVRIRRLYENPAGRLIAMSSDTRVFPPALAAFIRVRDGAVCRTPYCDAPIAHIDHTDPRAHGGPTSEANGAGLCAACNLAKAESGWSDAAASDGTITITTPTGRRYPSPPRPERGTLGNAA